MADDTPPGSASEQTSYSDPLYNRLEVIVEWLGKRWGLAVGVVAAVVIASLLAQYAGSYSADAASADALLQAEAASDPIVALGALVADSSHTAEFRSQAGITLAVRHLDEFAPDKATGPAEQAVALATGLATAANAKPRHQALHAAALLTLAAAYEQQDRLEDALALLDEVTSRYEAVQPDYGVQAGIRASLIRIELAERASDGETAQELRQRAWEDLDIYRRSQAPDELTRIAEWQYYELQRLHPDLAGHEVPEAKPTPTTATQPATAATPTATGG